MKYTVRDRPVRVESREPLDPSSPRVRRFFELTAQLVRQMNERKEERE